MGVGDSIAFHGRFSSTRLACVEVKTGRRFTYAEFDRRVAKCAGFLREALAEPVGARVALLARNSADLLALHFACVRTGSIFQPLNWRLSGAELKVLIADAQPELFIYQDEFETAAQAAMEGNGSIRSVLKISEPLDDLGRAIDAAPAAPAGDHARDNPILLLYTSGTTGKPKGVIITEQNAFTTALNFSGIAEIAPGDVALCDVPLFHVAGLCGLARAAMLKGATLYISDRFVPSAALKLLSDRALGFTHYFAVTQMGQLMRADPTYRSSDLKHLKAIISGGAPIPPSLIEDFLADGIHFVAGYGLSEAGTVFGMPPRKELMRKKPNSAGVPALLIEAKLIGQDGREVGADEIGEIWLRGPSVTPGYWNQPEATAKAFSPDRWFKTGDAAMRDEDGFYHIVDRWKDMFISGGENVYPAEVEAAIAALEGVADNAVIGVPDPQWGEVGCAFIVRAGGANLSEADVLEHCRARLARYKVPKLVRFVDSIPHTASGKIQKQELRRIFAARN